MTDGLLPEYLMTNHQPELFLDSLFKEDFNYKL